MPPCPMGNVNVGLGSKLMASGCPKMNVHAQSTTLGETLLVKSMRVSGAVVG